jgi:hypothetical protein
MDFIQDYESAQKINILYRYYSSRSPDSDEVFLHFPAPPGFGNPEMRSVRDLFSLLSLDEKLLETVYESSEKSAKIKENGEQKLADILNKEITFYHLGKDPDLPFYPRVLLEDPKTYKPSG